MGENTSLLGKIVTWAILVVIGLIALKAVLGLLGWALGIAGFLLFTVAPVVLLIWVGMKAWQAFSKPAT